MSQRLKAFALSFTAQG